MTAHHDAGSANFGPYTVLDLHDLNDDGKGFELEDGWLVEVAAGARHNFIAIGLGEIVKAAAAASDVYVCLGGEWEFSTPGGVRKPDVAVVPKSVARAAIIDEKPRLMPASEVLLAIEVVSPGSGSERADRVRKVREYAAVGIPEYWIVEQHPAVRIHRLVLDDGVYRVDSVGKEGEMFTSTVVSEVPFSIAFDPVDLLDI